MTPFVNFGQKGRRLRFFGKLALIGFHLDQPSHLSSNPKLADSACPAVCCGAKCIACLSGSSVIMKCAAVAWDIDKNRWVVCVAAPTEMGKVMAECRQIGCTEEMIEGGKGPDMIVQGWGMSLMISPMKETIGGSRGDGKIPCLEDQVGMLVKRSRFSEGKRTPKV